MVATFLEAILEGGIDNPNFFNGKVLTARDLRDLQASTVQRARRLGMTGGDGVAHGLFVEPNGATALNISAGLAVNRRGDALLLPVDVTLPLQASEQASAPLDSPFAPCETVLATTSVAVGFFVLVITPASELSRQQAQHSGLNASAATCTSRYEVEGVQLKLVTIGSEVFSPSGSQELQRSQLARACFGLDALQAHSDDPFHAPAYYGLLDELRLAGQLLDCDVPLAALHWSGSQIRFVDQWSVRRPLASPAATARFPLDVRGDEPFAQHASPRRRRDSLAMLLQFQDQLAGVPRNRSVYQHFASLPSAGYLPVGAGGFSLGRFFPENPDTLRSLDPAFLRLVFEQSFFIEPLLVEPGQPVEVEFFRLTGGGDDFIVFARREQEPVKPPEEEEPRPPEKEGTIVVTVTDPQGRTLLDRDIQRVTVSNKGFTGREARHEVVYEGQQAHYRVATQNRVDQIYGGARKRARTSPFREILPGDVPDIEVPDFPDIKLAVYVFKRKPGRYTVAAIPQASTGLRSTSTAVRLGSGQTREVTLALRKARKKLPPGGGRIPFDPDDPFVLPHGHMIDDIYVYPDWYDRFPHDPGYVDPLPDDWLVDPPPGIHGQVEDILGQYVPVDPTLAVEGVQIYVDPRYDPAQVQTGPYAFAQTGDGRVIPLLFGAGDTAIRGEVAVGQAGLDDLDPATQGALRDKGLDNLNAFNGAWTGLLGGVLGLDETGSQSLLADTRAAAQGFQGSFTRYPGVTAQADGALQASNLGDDVALANAASAEVLAALNSVAGASYSQGFAVRLIDRARANLPQSAWSLAALGLSQGQIDALGGMDITSVRQFTGALDQDRSGVKAALNVTDSALDQLANEARAGALSTRLQFAGSTGVAQVAGVSGDLAGLLVRAGYKTAADLSNADTAELAKKAGITAAEAGALKESAAEKAGTFALLQAEFGLDDAEVDGLKQAGIVSVRDFTASPETVDQIVSSDRVGTVSSVVGITWNRLGTTRLR